MRLSLSSAAAPDATLPELLAACARRGLAALELVEGHAHGIAIGIDAARARAVQTEARDAGVTICGLFLESVDSGDLDTAARLAATLQAPIVVPAPVVDAGLLSAANNAFSAAGAELLLAHGTDPGALKVLRRSLEALPEAQPIGLAWELRPDLDDAGLMDRVPETAGAHLRYVRLYGGGPEASRQTGRGVGAMMARLTLTRYGGPLVLTPSSSRYHYIWRAWLGRTGGWGCGSKADRSLVKLEETSAVGEHR